LPAIKRCFQPPDHNERQFSWHPTATSAAGACAMHRVTTAFEPDNVTNKGAMVDFFSR
jgi:hypothetical protein